MRLEWKHHQPVHLLRHRAPEHLGQWRALFRCVRMPAGNRQHDDDLRSGHQLGSRCERASEPIGGPADKSDCHSCWHEPCKVLPVGTRQPDPAHGAVLPPCRLTQPVLAYHPPRRGSRCSPSFSCDSDSHRGMRSTTARLDELVRVVTDDHRAIRLSSFSNVRPPTRTHVRFHARGRYAPRALSRQGAA